MDERYIYTCVGTMTCVQRECMLYGLEKIKSVKNVTLP